MPSLNSSLKPVYRSNFLVTSAKKKQVLYPSNICVCTECTVAAYFFMEYCIRYCIVCFDCTLETKKKCFKHVACLTLIVFELL